MNISKPQIHQQCLVLALAKRDEITHSIKRVQESLTAEGKSTAGDKHETGRAMLQLEREKLGVQLKNAETIYTILKKIDPYLAHFKVAVGSIVITDVMTYYLTASVGKITHHKTTVFAISPQSPIGNLLLGKEKGDVFQFNGTSQTILEVN